MSSVLHVITRLIRGGAQENTVLTACLHSRWGLPTAILTGLEPPGPDPDLAAEARAAGVPLIPVPGLQREPDPLRDTRALCELLLLLRSQPAALVHTHTSKAGFIGRLAARLAGAPAVVHTPHGHIFDAYYGRLTTSLYTLLERIAAAQSDRLVALTPSEISDHRQRGVGDARSFLVVPSGIDMARFHPGSPETRAAARVRLAVPPRAWLVGCVGRLEAVKGQRLLLEAFSGLLASQPRAHLCLVGDGSQRAELGRLADRLGIGQRVHLHGHERDPGPLYPAFDVLAVPSLNEGMGRVILEGMASRLPIVASAVGGIPDLIESGHNGLLVPPRDPAALTTALCRLAAQPQLAERLARAAQAGVGEHFSAEAMARRLLALYRQLLPDL